MSSRPSASSSDCVIESSYAGEPSTLMCATIFPISVSSMYAPCTRIRREVPGGRNSMSPRPSSCSAPLVSMIVRESTFEETRKEMREGKFALIRPVMTSTEGRCVASTR